MPEEEWDEGMPLPGDIIEGVAEDSAEEFILARGKDKSELSYLLGRLNREVEEIRVRVRRGDATVNLKACVVPEKTAKLHRRFTIRAASDTRHVVVLGDLTLDQCIFLQEMSRRMVHVGSGTFHRREMDYDWRKKMGSYLPDHRSTVVASILFMPLPGERGTEATTSRSMAWFSAAVSSGVPLVFVNIQTDPKISKRNEQAGSESGQSSCWEMASGRNQNNSVTFDLMQGIRIWFLPGVVELPVTLKPESGESRYGIDIKCTEEGFLYISSVAEGSAADRAGLHQLHEHAYSDHRLVVISRLQGKCLTPNFVTSKGMVSCCDHLEVKELLVSAIDRMDNMLLHIMLWYQEAPSGALGTSRLGSFEPTSIPKCHKNKPVT
ncbi:hypothetical protein AMTR_s00024p00207330 [Amborella trichopoda]|uniref:Uncharacterized protein n=2 Tax=Amborella trichopoda TaxID=13333 RepID=W1PT39_AMBTC|nr:hypothetical protein AMTR_s00024p00207330 [Amborella trichopoda]